MILDDKKVINWNVDDYGLLRVYYGDNTILFEISECARCSEKDIQMIIDEELDTMGYEWLENGTLKEKESV